MWLLQRAKSWQMLHSKILTKESSKGRRTKGRGSRVKKLEVESNMLISWNLPRKNLAKRSHKVPILMMSQMARHLVISTSSSKKPYLH